MTFEELRDRVYALYADGRYDEALGVLEAEQDALGGHEATGTFWAACLLSVSGRPDDVHGSFGRSSCTRASADQGVDLYGGHGISMV